MNIGVTINACSMEKAFLPVLLSECLKFSNDVVVSYGDKLYNGELEDLSYIEQNKTTFPNIKFVSYCVDIHSKHETRLGVNKRPTAYWHNLARYTASQALDEKTDWVFIIDADEVPEGDLVADWINNTKLEANECYKMANYWYFKYPILRSLTFEDSVLLMHKSHLTKENMFGDLERDFLIPSSKTILKRLVMGKNKLPIWHHFSFVRSRDNLKKKLESWAHRDDVKFDVDELLNKVYKCGSDDDSAVYDFIHGYKYKKVLNQFNIDIDIV